MPPPPAAREERSRSGSFANEGGATAIGNPNNTITNGGVRVEMNGEDFKVGDGSVVIAAITSCTNTSNPAVMLAAGLVAKKAAARGLKSKPWVKTSLAPGSKVVTDYLEKTGLLTELEKTGFYLVGYGCTTCIGNSGPLPQEISKAISAGDLTVGAVISGNRNFEGRVHAEVKMNYLASPPLVVAYALAGSLDINLTTEPLGQGSDGKDVFLKDVWPSNQEISDLMASAVTSDMFKKNYADVFKGDERWNAIASPDGALYAWDEASTYIKNPPYFDGMTMELGNGRGHPRRALPGPVRRLDHHRPHLAGRLDQEGFARRSLPDLARRAADRLQLLRFAPRQRRRDGARHLRQHPHQEPDAGWRRRWLHPSCAQRRTAGDLRRSDEVQGDQHAAGGHRRQGIRHRLLARLGGQGHLLLGVKAVITESFERIHRSNLVGMGVLPLRFKNGENAKSLGLTGNETFDITGLDNGKSKEATVTATAADGSKKQFSVYVMLLTPKERDFFRHGGILQYVLRQLAGKKAA